MRTPRLTLVWAFLSAVTVVSWSLGRSARHGGQAVASTSITIAVLAIAAVKARLIISTFMEVRTAPTWLQLATDAWLVVLWGAVLGIYLL